MNDFKILISSCDKYSYLWDVLKFSHQNYLGDDFLNKTTIISESKQHDHFKTYNCIGTWRDMILSYLKSSSETYILYLQDDYMFWKKTIPIEYFNDLVSLCVDKDIDHLVLTNKADLYKPIYQESNKWGELYKREYNGDYLACLQTGIWKREYFIKLLESFIPDSIWGFEILANKYCVALNAKLYLFYNVEDGIGRVFEPSEIVRKGNVLDNIKVGGAIRDKWILDFPDKKEEIEKLLLSLKI